MHVGLYARVSTEEQAQGFSIDHQTERMQAYCVSQGWPHYDLYIDDGYTGTNMNRPHLKRLLQHIKEGRIQVVLVYKLDRLSRKQKDVLHLLEDVFDKYQTGFRSVTEPFDTSTPFGKAMIGMLAVFAQLERDTIIERTRSGKSQRTRQGLWYGGPVPFGYELSPTSKQLVQNTSQASLVREMFSQFTQGNSYLSIARWLALRSTERKFSSPKTLVYMLSNPIYVGKLKHRDELVEAQHPPIIDPETWNQAQAELNLRRSGRAKYGKYLLSNLLVCGVCGAKMKHIRMKDQRREVVRARNYYLCSTKHSRGKCGSRYYPERELEERTIEALTRLALDPALVRTELANFSAPEIPDQPLLDELTAKLLELNAKLDRWYDAFEAGHLEVSKVRERLAPLEHEKASLLIRLSELDKLRELRQRQHELTDSDLRHNLGLDLVSDGAIATAQQQRDTSLDCIPSISNVWIHLAESERAAILRAAVNKITVHADGSLEFAWNS
ncbi:MAG: hypothetical protein A2201_02390 [Alicyclobacillus sp. RIFOXYA1_FULL_53_8]|nr:MAG: hypothetical protein A2201_02390 [Alicyclobacillus sp. RIFOXYA1_FULL_53_8]